MTASNQLQKGERVRYVPAHACGDANHPDCEDGAVSSVNDSGTVFVKYDCQLGLGLTGDEPWTAKGTNPEDLVRI